MTAVKLATEFAFRTGEPRQSLTNMYPEPTPQGPRDYALRPRPNLAKEAAPAWSNAVIGSGPIDLIEQDGGSTYVKSGTGMYLNGTALTGSFASGGVVQGARSMDQFAVTSGYSAYSVDPTSVIPITDPDLPQVIGVVIANGRAVYPERDSNTYYYSEVGDVTSIDGLNFISAEADPDPIVRILKLGDELAIFGAEVLEFHQPSSDPDNPFRRAPGRTQNIGLAGAYTAINVDNGIYFVGQADRAGRGVYRTYGSGPEKVSTLAIDQALESLDLNDMLAATAFRILRNGHDTYILNLPNVGSYAFDVPSGKWSQWTSYGLATFRILTGDGIYYGDHLGNVYRHSDGYSDNGDAITYTVSAFAPAGGVERCNRLVLQCFMGVGLVSGQGSAPVVEMRYSDDLGGNWSTWESATLGTIGQYEARAQWHQLGMMGRTGRLFELRCTDPVLFVLYDILINPPR